MEGSSGAPVLRRSNELPMVASPFRNPNPSPPSKPGGRLGEWIGRVVAFAALLFVAIIVLRLLWFGAGKLLGLE